MESVLQDVTVLDFSEYIAGPYCGQLLADMGARVIKIEPPDGAEERRIGAPWRYRGNTRMGLAFNRGKESLSVDLRSEEGRAIAHRLVEVADVVVQNFAPGIARKMGIDYDTLAKINPRLIFLSSTAFGEVGPYEKRKGFDIIAHAASGVMSNYADEEGAPRGPGGPPFMDIGTGMLNALGIVAALLNRTRTGLGQKIESSLFATGLVFQAMQMVYIDALDDDEHAEHLRTLRVKPGEGMVHTKVVDKFAELRLRADLPKTTRPVEVPDCLHRPTDRQVYPYYRVYQTGDGYMSIAALNRAQRVKVCAVLDIVDEHVDLDVGNISDEAYFKQKAIMRVIEKRLRGNSSEHWIAKLEEVGVPCGRVNYRADLYTDPQVKSCDLIWESENSTVGRYKATAYPLHFSRTPARAVRGAPSLGEHTTAILREAGFSDAEVSGLRERGTVK